MGSRSLRAAVAPMLGVLFMAAGAAHATDLPPIREAGTASYLTGGIGQDESSALKAAERNWPLSLEFAEQNGRHADYVADVHVVVRDSSGAAAFKAKADGPFLLAKLPPGRYIVEANWGGKTLREPVTIRHGARAHATFVWPAGIDDSVV